MTRPSHRLTARDPVDGRGHRRRLRRRRRQGRRQGPRRGHQHGPVQSGKVVLELDKFRHTGKQKVAVKFKGSRLAKPTITDLEIKVVH